MTKIEEVVKAQALTKPRLYGWDAVYGPGANGVQDAARKEQMNEVNPYSPGSTWREKRQIDCERLEHDVRACLDALLGKGAYEAVGRILRDYQSYSAWKESAE